MKRKPAVAEQMRANYDFDYSNAVRGKYYRRILKEGSNVAVLEPDIAKAFPNSAAVNDALRVVLEAGKPARKSTSRARSRAARPTRAG
jgi:hypothetical protein